MRVLWFLHTIQGVSDGGAGDPLAWSGTNPSPSFLRWLPNLYLDRAPYRPDIELTPTNLATFTDGVWTGALLAAAPARDVILTAYGTNKYWNGVSDAFSVLVYPFKFADEAIRVDSNSITLAWYSGSGVTYRLLTSTQLVSGFTILATNLPSTPPLNTYTTAIAPEAGRFYSLEEEVTK